MMTWNRIGIIVTALFRWPLAFVGLWAGLDWLTISWSQECFHKKLLHLHLQVNWSRPSKASPISGKTRFFSKKSWNRWNPWYKPDSGLITLFEKSNFCPKIQFWQNPNIFTSFSPKFFWQFFSWNQSCQQLKSPKPQHFHEFYTPKNRQFSREIFLNHLGWVKVGENTKWKEIDNVTQFSNTRGRLPESCSTSWPPTCGQPPRGYRARLAHEPIALWLPCRFFVGFS